MKQIILVISIFTITFLTSCAHDNEYAEIMSIEKEGLNLSRVTLSNGQAHMLSHRYLCQNHLQVGMNMRILDTPTVPDTVLMKIQSIEEIKGKNKNTYWIAHFIPDDIYVHIEATRVVYEERPRLGDTMDFELVFGGIGNPSSYEPIITYSMGHRLRIKDLFLAMTQSQNVISKEYYDFGGFGVTFRENNSMYTIQFSEKSIKKIGNAEMTFLLYPDKGEHEFLHDVNQDGYVDSGTNIRGEKSFDQRPSTSPFAEGAEHKIYWQKKMNNALQDAYNHFGIKNDSLVAALF